jgi:hypothetical protein
VLEDDGGASRSGYICAPWPPSVRTTLRVTPRPLYDPGIQLTGRPQARKSAEVSGQPNSRKSPPSRANRQPERRSACRRQATAGLGLVRIGRTDGHCQPEFANDLRFGRRSGTSTICSPTTMSVLIRAGRSIGTRRRRAGRGRLRASQAGGSERAQASPGEKPSFRTYWVSTPHASRRPKCDPKLPLDSDDGDRLGTVMD